MNWLETTIEIDDRIEKLSVRDCPACCSDATYIETSTPYAQFELSCSDCGYHAHNKMWTTRYKTDQELEDERQTARCIDRWFATL